MEWSARMNSAIAYIEDNLEGEIDFAQAAQKACCSLFHFQRMFLVVIGVTPAEYARHRKLTLAASDITSGNDKVIDVALKYGYDSPDSFARAFRNVHGVTPQAARAPGVKLTAFPRVSFNIELKGGTDMDYRMIQKLAFDAVGTARKFTSANGENFIKIPQFWQEYMNLPDYKRLMDLTGGKPGAVTGAGCLGICLPTDKNSWDEFRYAIAIEKPGKTDPAGFETFHIPAANWAVFDCTFPTLQDVTRRIWSEWFPSTGYEHDAKPDFEVYLPEDPRSKIMQCQIWIPVVKKNKK
jgi:AraC family transcriptional regulator